MSILEDCQIASKDSYHFGSTPPTGYNSIGQFNNPNTGYQGVAYYNESTNTLIIASRGSEERETKQDWIANDGNMFLGNLPSQIDDAYSFAKNTIDKLAKQHPDADIYFTGHSLGGSLSQMLGSLDDFDNSNTITFNAYGTGNLQDKLKQKYNSSGNHSSNIDNYITKGDSVSNSSPQVGNKHYLEPSKRSMDYYRNNDFYHGEYYAHMDILNTPAKDFKKARGTDGPVKDPIIFDLNGDGVKTTNVTNGIYLDYENDGFAESTAWADQNDGVLVVDLNNNGEISGNEILTHTALTAYDTNSDGIIDSSDTNFTTLKILTKDGILETLTEAGIASINLTTSSTNITDENGNVQFANGSFTRIDNTTASYGEFNLQTNTAYSIATDWVDVSDTISALPDISGYGTIHSLHQAMALDSDGSLTTLVQNFIAATTDTSRWTLIDQILDDLAGANSVSTTSRGDYVNAQHLAVVEAFMGEDFIQTTTNSANPTQEAGDFLEQAYIGIRNLVYAELMSQSHAADLFNEIITTYDSTTNRLKYDLSVVITTLQAAIATDATTGKQLVVEFATALKGLGLADSSNYSSLTDSSCFYNTFTENDRDLKWQLDIIGKSYDTAVLTREGTAKDDAMRTDSINGEDFHSLEGDDKVIEIKHRLKLCA